VQVTPQSDQYTWRVAETQYLLPGMPVRQHQPNTPPSPVIGPEEDWPEGWGDEDVDWDEGEDDGDGHGGNYWDGRDGWKHQQWMHVSPTKMEPGTILSPGGGTSPYGGKTYAPGHSSNVWIDFPHTMGGWTNEMREHSPDSPFYYYDVEPGDRPEANVLGPELGWNVPSARIIQERQGFDPDDPEGWA